MDLFSKVVVKSALTLFFVLFSVCPLIAETSARNSVVKIYTTYNQYNFHEPWQTLGQQLRQGSGCIISKNRILTNAHIVSDQTFVQVRRAGHAKKFTAKVEVVNHDCDLAILSVKDSSFFANTVPLEIGDLPLLQDRITVLGYPQGGDTLGVTEGVLSRVEHREYVHSQANLLAAQIDAPINSGNSGGPVIKDGKIAGVSFQGLIGLANENVGYMVPVTVIRQFLKDIDDNRLDGIPELGFAMQKLENESLRRMFGLSGSTTGVLINKVYPESPGEGFIFPDDVLLEVDGHPVENDGTVEFRRGERTYLGYYWQNKQIGEPVDLTVLRGGNVLNVTLTLNQPMGFERLVYAKRYDKAPTYYIYGGLVFSTLTLSYLHEYGNWALNAPKDLLSYYLSGEPTDKQREIVLLVKVLSDELNDGYHSFVDGVIRRINGKNIARIEDVVSAFENARGPYHIIEDVRGYRLVLDRNDTEHGGGDILQRYHVPKDRSLDLQ